MAPPQMGYADAPVASRTRTAAGQAVSVYTLYFVLCVPFGLNSSAAHVGQRSLQQADTLWIYCNFKATTFGVPTVCLCGFIRLHQDTTCGCKGDNEFDSVGMQPAGSCWQTLATSTAGHIGGC